MTIGIVARSASAPHSKIDELTMIIYNDNTGSHCAIREFKIPETRRNTSLALTFRASRRVDILHELGERRCHEVGTEILREQTLTFQRQRKGMAIQDQEEICWKAEGFIVRPSHVIDRSEQARGFHSGERAVRRYINGAQVLILA